MLIGYARVTTLDQIKELEAQREALRHAGCTQFFHDIDQEVAANHVGVQPGFQACLRALTSGDHVVVCSLDRLGLGSAALADLISRLGEENRGVKSLDDDTDTLTPMTSGCPPLSQWPVLGFCHSLREMEEILEQERYARKQATPRKEHKGGRKPALSSQQAARAREMHQNKGLTVAEVCQKLGISRTTFYRSLNRSLS